MRIMFSVADDGQRLLWTSAEAKGALEKLAKLGGGVS